MFLFRMVYIGSLLRLCLWHPAENFVELALVSFSHPNATKECVPVQPIHNNATSMVALVAFNVIR